jgi:hypothetical protein
MLTVSIPTHNTPPDLLERAVRSVLASPEVGRLVVVNDAGATPMLPADSRVVLYRMPANRGRYFCDAAVTQAINGWWSPHDADDWSEPGRWRHYNRAQASIAGHVQHRADRHTAHPVGVRRVGSEFLHVAHWCAGVYHTDRVAAAGGILPQFRVGFDTLFLLMVRLTGPVRIDPQTAYHYDRRHGTLTSCRETGWRSPFRAAQAEQLRRLYQAAWNARRDLLDPAGPLRQSVPDRLRFELADHADRLKAALC